MSCSRSRQRRSYIEKSGTFLLSEYKLEALRWKGAGLSENTFPLSGSSVRTEALAMSCLCLSLLSFYLIDFRVSHGEQALPGGLGHAQDDGRVDWVRLASFELSLSSPLLLIIIFVFLCIAFLWDRSSLPTSLCPALCLTPSDLFLFSPLSLRL